MLRFLPAGGAPWNAQSGSEEFFSRKEAQEDAKAKILMTKSKFLNEEAEELSVMGYSLLGKNQRRHR